MANSKLDMWDKADRKAMIESLPEGSEMFAVANFTFLFVPTCRGAAVVSWAVAGDGEGKFKRKVGEFHALLRWSTDRHLPVPAGADWEAFAWGVVNGS